MKFSLNTIKKLFKLYPSIQFQLNEVSNQRRLIFHAGIVKTGSTYIQKKCSENQNILEKMGLNYLDITKPNLKLPKWSNADFLFEDKNNFSDEFIAEKICSSAQKTIIISDEALWANIHVINRPCFANFKKTIILYIRDPAETIASWAGENSKPYNVLLANGEVVSIGFGLERYTEIYINIFNEFIEKFKSLSSVELVIRLYLKKIDLFEDFLMTILKDKSLVLENKFNFGNEIVNKSENRKYCDISSLTYIIVKAMGREDLLSYDLINYIYVQCKTGSSKSIIETIPKKILREINLKCLPTLRKLQTHCLFNIDKALSTPSWEKYDEFENNTLDPYEVFMLIKTYLNENHL
jgi:hypothetical protein